MAVQVADEKIQLVHLEASDPQKFEQWPPARFPIFARVHVQCDTVLKTIERIDASPSRKSPLLMAYQSGDALSMRLIS